jgi:hypothetical protein
MAAYQALLQETVPAPKSRPSLIKMLSLLPQGEGRDALLVYANQLELTIQSKNKSKLTQLCENWKRVPKTTWVIVALTIPICTIWYLFLKYISPTYEKKRESSLRNLLEKVTGI